MSVNRFEIEDPARFARTFDETSPFDQWWLDFVRDVDGIDLRSIGLVGAPPEPTYVWQDAAQAESR